jgi:hypothetical protein
MGNGGGVAAGAPRRVHKFNGGLSVTWRALLWWLAPVGLTIILFAIEAVRRGPTVSFDLLTGTVSVSQVHAGPAGWCLLFAGYLVLPAAIAVVASAVFANQVRTMTPEEVDARFDANYERVFNEKPPGQSRA